MMPVADASRQGLLTIDVGDHQPIDREDSAPSDGFALQVTDATKRRAVVIHSDNTNGPHAPSARIPTNDQEGLSWKFCGLGGWVFKRDAWPVANTRFQYGVVAQWPIEEDSTSEFLRLAWKNATASVTLEEDCLAFGVFQATGAKPVFALIEVFSDEASFEFHLQTPHFDEFARFARPVFRGLRSRTVKGQVSW